MNLTFSILLVISYIKFLYGCEMYRFVSTDGLALEGHVIKTTVQLFIPLCWSDCVGLPWCFSINSRKTSEGMFECELNNSSKKANPSKIAPRKGWSYQEMKDFSNINCKVKECKRKEDLGNGWFRYGDSAIKLFTEKKNWTDARSHCQSLGGDLLSITSSHENDFVNEIFVDNLNVTYIQEDKKINLPYRHFKLNGDESQVRLLGVKGDAEYKLDGREKALYLNGKTGEAEIPSTSIKPDGFALFFWIKPLEPYLTAFVFGLFTDSQNASVLKLVFESSQLSVKLKINKENIESVGLELGVWQPLCISWNKRETKVRYGKWGKWTVTDEKTITSIDNISKVTIRFGRSSNNFHGFFKHLVLVDGTIYRHEFQTIMYWHKQGVWIGLNTPKGSDGFSWSDGTPVGQFMNLPDYNPKPNKSGRKCVAMAKDKKWLDKHCDLKYPFLCEKPAPP